MTDAFWSPAGTFIAVRPDPGGQDFWIVYVFNFALWKHSTQTFPTEVLARAYADLWRI